MPSAIRQRSPEELAAGYTRAHRLLEVTAIVLLGALLALLAIRIAGSLSQAPWTFPLALKPRAAMPANSQKRFSPASARLSPQTCPAPTSLSAPRKSLASALHS